MSIRKSNGASVLTSTECTSHWCSSGDSVTIIGGATIGRDSVWIIRGPVGLKSESWLVLRQSITMKSEWC